jgi:hypothetical protein
MSPALFSRAALCVAFVASLASAQSNPPVPNPMPDESIQRFHDLVPSIVRQANLRTGQTVIISGSTAYLPWLTLVFS